MDRYLVFQVPAARRCTPADWPGGLSCGDQPPLLLACHPGFEATPQADREIAADMRKSGNYQVIDVVRSSVGQYTIWAYEPLRQSASQHGGG